MLHHERNSRAAPNASLGSRNQWYSRSFAMPRRLFTRTAQLAVDVTVLAAAYVLAFVVRFEGRVPLEMARTLAWTLPYLVALQYGLFLTLGVHRLAWRYVGLHDVRRIGGAVLAGTAVLVGLRILSGRLLPAVPWTVRAVVPFGVILVFSAFAFLGIVGVRVIQRILAERFEIHVHAVPRSAAVRTMLVGAGRSGVLVVKEILARPDLGIFPVGFLDDDPVKVGTLVHGIAVLGTTERLLDLCNAKGARQVLIAMASAPGKEIRRIVKLCERARLSVKIIPAFFEIVGGRVNLSRIREVAIEDLLGREPVKLDEDAVYGVVRGRGVLVTGAGGSIGSELARQICRFSPASLVLVEHSENNLFQIDRELRKQHPHVAVHSYLADIRDGARVAEILGKHRSDVVFHAAAHKHVPLMEDNPSEAVKNNVVGTMTLARLADSHGVSEFVMISTDKAVNPTSVMGASKRAAEIFIQALSQRSKTRFVAVRFGNVLGSAGSVVPIFREQIARGGPITVTDPEMKRYFMTIPEACQLVLQAGSMGRGGEIFVLDMGEPVKIVDLARDLIALSGLREPDDIEIHYTGVRPGEKLFEELSLAGEHAERTRHPKIFIGQIERQPWDEVLHSIAKLELAAESGDKQQIRAAFREMVPEYTPHEAVRSPSTPTTSEDRGQLPIGGLAVSSNSG
jgi:FlaA1/EpsC-like NDP-sugar epimerase